MRVTTLDASGPVRIRLGRRSCQARARRRLVQQLRYSQSDWTSFWGLPTNEHERNRNEEAVIDSGPFVE
jgi:hypothetical protein